MENAEQQAIRQVIERAYIEGIHGTQDEETVRSGFHEDFAMLVLQDGVLEKVSVEEWLHRIQGMKVDNPDMWSAETEHKFQLIDIAGYAAVAKLDVYKGETHFSTDYMLLYRFEDGWKIVSKVFAIPG
ncbi:MAG: nuclear transport factor 2 family protein [Anaerolineae bacterium]